MFFFYDFNDTYKDALIVKLVCDWNESSTVPLGRTLIQKLCYFAEAVGVPLGYAFSVYQYGPYSQELYAHIDDMVSAGLVYDRNAANRQKAGTSAYAAGEAAAYLLDLHKDALCKDAEAKIRFVVEHFRQKTPRQLELLSTTHYYYAANKSFHRGADEISLKDSTIMNVAEAKKRKFDRSEIEEAYRLIRDTPQLN